MPEQVRTFWSVYLAEKSEGSAQSEEVYFRSSFLRNFQKKMPEDLISTNKKWAFLIRKGLLFQEIYFKGSEIVAKQNSKVVKSEESRGKSHQIIKVIIRKCVEIWNSYYLTVDDGLLWWISGENFFRKFFFGWCGNKIWSWATLFRALFLEKNLFFEL